MGKRKGKLWKWPCLLAKVEVLGCGLRHARSDAPHLADGRKKGWFGHYKKIFFGGPKNIGFLADFENCWKTAGLINKDRHLVKWAFFVFGQKGVKNSLEKNIVSNLR